MLDLTQVVDRLADLDPLDLVSTGAPRDEYTPEAPEILELMLADNLNAATLGQVFLHWFGSMDIPQETLETMARELNAMV